MVSTQDRRILREVAKHVADIAGLPVQKERRQLWSWHKLGRCNTPN